jgi:hypothetical protein
MNFNKIRKILKFNKICKTNNIKKNVPNRGIGNDEKNKFQKFS